LTIPHALEQQHADKFDTLDPDSPARKATNLTEDSPNVGSLVVYLNLVEWICLPMDRHIPVLV
jgi:hypothetical protein